MNLSRRMRRRLTIANAFVFQLRPRHPARQGRARQPLTTPGPSPFAPLHPRSQATCTSTAVPLAPHPLVLGPSNLRHLRALRMISITDDVKQLNDDGPCQRSPSPSLRSSLPTPRQSVGRVRTICGTQGDLQLFNRRRGACDSGLQTRMARRFMHGASSSDSSCSLSGGSRLSCPSRRLVA